MCRPLRNGCSACKGGGPRFKTGAKRGLRLCDVIPNLYQTLLRALISKNLDDRFSPPVTAEKCNASGGERIAANLRSLQLPKGAADQMITSPAARMDVSETHTLRFETRKNERETCQLQRESLSPK